MTNKLFALLTVTLIGLSSLTMNVYATETETEAAKQKRITVTYETEAGVYKGTENVYVTVGTETIAPEQLKAMPENAELIGEIKIEGRFATAVVRVEEKTFEERVLEINFVNEKGHIVERTAKFVMTGTSTITVSAPINYELVEDAIVAIDDETTSINVLVRRIDGEEVTPESEEVETTPVVKPTSKPTNQIVVNTATK